MRVFSRLLAAPSGVGAQAGNLRQVPLALLPPIPLYRRLLRAHRKCLPVEMRLLGDEYVKSEFRAHRDIDNPVHIVGISMATLALNNLTLLGRFPHRMAIVRTKVRRSGVAG